MNKLFRLFLAVLAAISFSTNTFAEQPAEGFFGASDRGSVIMGRFQTTPTPINTPGKVGPIAMTSSGQLQCAVTDTSGNSLTSIPFAQGSVGAYGAASMPFGWRRRANDTAETGSTATVINATAHVAQIGDLILIQSGTASEGTSFVTATTANTITVNPPLLAAPANGDQFIIGIPNPVGIIATSGNAGMPMLSVSVNRGDGGGTSGGASGAGFLLKDGTTGAYASGDAGVGAWVRQTGSSAFASPSTTADRYVPMQTDRDGRLAVNAYGANVTNFFSSCGTATATTADVAIKAAVASNRMYVTDITCKNTSATVATSLDFKDGSTILAVGGISQMATASPGSFTQTFPVPLQGTVNTAFNFATNVSTTSVTCCIHGYTSIN